MSVMMANVATEAIMVEMEMKKNLFMKVVKDQDHSITTSRDQMKTLEIFELSQTPIVKVGDRENTVL